MVLFNQPTHFKHSIFKTNRVFQEEKAEEPGGYDEEEDNIPVVDNERQYLPGERLLKKINKQRKKDKKKKRRKKELTPESVGRISASLSRTVRSLT
jgi:hypothetical protein